MLFTSQFLYAYGQGLVLRSIYVEGLTGKQYRALDKISVFNSYHRSAHLMQSLGLDEQHNYMACFIIHA